MTAYYNEIDPEAAAWLQIWIDEGIIARGVVDARDIREVTANDLTGFTQCHFFAGIGGWSIALKLAGWPDDRPVWTGSCPCQPFSAAGSKARQSDERHLWPHWSRLISQSKPSVVFGEQVARGITLGWLDDAFHDLEASEYACATTVLPSCSVNAPDERQRLWFVADGSMRDDYRKARIIQGADEQKQGTSRSEKRLPKSNGSSNSIGIEGIWRMCNDGITRLFKPGVRILDDGFPGYGTFIQGVGNTINVEVASTLIKAVIEVLS